MVAVVVVRNKKQYILKRVRKLNAEEMTVEERERERMVNKVFVLREDGAERIIITHSFFITFFSFSQLSL